MSGDDRDILEILEEELSFLEKGGYGRSVRTPWLPKSIFQDSLSCLNYGYPKRVHPCSECRLIEFVSPEDRFQPVPCHHIRLRSSGETIEELEYGCSDFRVQDLVGRWLRSEIERIQAERSQNTTAKIN